MADDARPPAGGFAGTSRWPLARVVDDLREARQRWRASQNRAQETGGRELPSREAVRDIVAALAGALFPMRLGPPDVRQETEDFYVGHTLDIALTSLEQQALLEARHAECHLVPGTIGVSQAADALHQFATALPKTRATLDTDILAAFHGDPAARSVDEVLMCYPGIAATIHYRIAHALWTLKLPLLARMIAELAHEKTGIDIHPGATIGGAFFIDHGTGVVIGETTVIGERVRLYQAVTLGAKRFPANTDGTLRKGLRRHPTVEDDVVIYAGATILGDITIGRGSSIGGNVWLTRSVAPGSRVVQASSEQYPLDSAAAS